MKHHWLFIVGGAVAGYFLYTSLQTLPGFTSLDEIFNGDSTS